MSKGLTTGGAHSDNILISSNQARASIDIRRNGYWAISLDSQKSCNKIILDFGKNMNAGISVNPSRTIRSIVPQITKTSQGILVIFDSIRVISYIAYKSVPWHGTRTKKVKSLKATEFSKTLSTRIILKLKRLGAKIL